MSAIFGANWKTTVFGLLTVITGAIAAKHSIVSFLPDGIEGYVTGFCDFIVYVFGGAFAFVAKDKHVTGGLVQQTANGNVAAPGTQNLVDETIRSTIESGERVTPEQKQAVHP